MGKVKMIKYAAGETYLNREFPVWMFEGKTAPKLLNREPRADLKTWLCMMLVVLTSGFNDTNTVNNDTP